jgi:hypothetical protein
VTPAEYRTAISTRQGVEMPMTSEKYRAAIASLGLSQLAAGRWLGVSNKTAQRYATGGPTGPAAKAIQMALKHGLS